MKKIFLFITAIFLIAILTHSVSFSQAVTYTPFATTGTPIPYRFASTNNGLKVDSTVWLVKYKATSDTTLLAIDTGGKVYKITKSMIANWATGGGGSTLTFGYGLTGSSYNGAAPITTTVDSAKFSTIGNRNKLADSIKNNYLSLDGGTMRGNLNMGNNTILAVSDLQSPPTADLNLNADNNIKLETTTGIATYNSNEIATVDQLTNGTVTSIDLNMPSAFSVTGGPITSSGTLTVTGNGTSGQYITGTGALATFPTIPSQFAPTSGYGISQTGSYPNINFKADTTVIVSKDYFNAHAGSGSVSGVTGTSPIASSGGANPDISIANAAADGSTKGAASFTANDFNSISGNIAIDYTNGQTADGSTKGFLNSTDWNTFNSKQGALTVTAIGSSGPSTLVGNTLNIPQYSGGGGSGVTKTTLPLKITSDSIYRTQVSAGAIYGNSLLCAFASGPYNSVRSYLLTAADSIAGCTVADKALSGATIANQLATWQADANKATYDWVFICEGANDIVFPMTLSTTLLAYQNLIDTMRATGKATLKIIIGATPPEKAFFISQYGSTNGATTYANWLAFNDAVMGRGASPILRVDYRTEEHNLIMNDGNGNLSEAFNYGDGLHENNIARQFAFSYSIRKSLVASGFYYTQPEITTDKFQYADNDTVKNKGGAFAITNFIARGTIPAASGYGLHLGYDRNSETSIIAGIKNDGTTLGNIILNSSTVPSLIVGGISAISGKKNSFYGTTGVSGGAFTVLNSTLPAAQGISISSDGTTVGEINTVNASIALLPMRLNFSGGAVVVVGNFAAGVGNATLTATAKVHIGAGTATASTAPLKFTSGTNLTTPENGAIEYDGADYFATSASTRYKITKTSSGGANATIGTATLSSGTVTVNTTAVLTGSRIIVIYNTPSGTLASGLSAPSASIVNGTSFVINSLTTAGLVNTLDNSTVTWWIIN